MGLFSSKKEYLAHAASSSVIESPKSTFRSLLLQTNIANNGGGPASALKGALATDMYARARAMLKYAAKPDGYIRGFPESNMDIIVTDPAQIEAALARDIGAFDSITTQVASRVQLDFFVERWLKDNYANDTHFGWGGNPPTEPWDANAATIAIPVTDPTTGEYYQANNLPDVTEIFSVDRDDIDEDDWVVETTATGKFEIAYSYTDSNGDPQTYEMLGNADLSDYTQSSETFIQVRYVIGEETFYWVYTVGSDVDPILEQYIDIEDRYGQYLPVLVLMQDKVWFDAQPESTLAITTNRLAKKLGTSGTDIKEDFQEQEEEDNKSGDKNKSDADKWDFFVHFAVPIRTQVRGSLEYLIHYFQQLEEWQGTDYTEYEKYLNHQIQSQPLNEIRVQEAGPNGYNAAYRWSYVHTVEKEGTYDIYDKVEAVTRPMRQGEYQSELVRREGTPDAEYRKLLDEIFPELPGVATYNSKAEEENHDYIVITRQNRVGEGEPETYTQVIMMGLGLEYTINTKDEITGKAGYRYRYASPLIWDDEETDPEVEGQSFRFPVHAASLIKVSRMHREEILQDSLTATVFLVQVIKRKWYETGFFKWLIIIIAVVLIVLSFVYAGGAGSSELGGLIGAMVSATGATGFAAAVLYTVFSFAVGMIISLASQLIGGTAGQIFAIVAAVAFFYSAGGFQGISTSWTNLTNQPGFGMALTFVQAVSPIYHMGLQVYTVADGYKLQQEMEEFQKDAKEKLEELKDMYDGLAPMPEGVNEWDLIQVFQREGEDETPKSFLARTTDPNPGQKAVDLINDFPEIALIPPKRSGETGIIQGMFVDLAQQRGAV